MRLPMPGWLRPTRLCGDTAARKRCLTAKPREKALAAVYRALDIDSLNARIMQNLSVSYMFAGYYRKALIMLERNEELFPQIEHIYSTKMGVYILTDQPERAIQEAGKINLAELKIPMVIGYLGLFYSWLGMHSKARQILDRMLSLRQQVRIVP